MKRRIHRILGLLPVVVILASSATVSAQSSAPADTLLSPAQWIEFNDNVTQAIRSDNPGVLEGGLRMIIRYGHYLSMDRDAAFRIMRVYRDNEREATRRMAVLALGNMEDRWAIEFLDMLAPTEKSAVIQKTMMNVVDAYWQNHGGNPYKS